jgi:hypothetical protein
MRLLESRTLFAAGEKERQSYRDDNGNCGSKHQMRQRGHSWLLPVIRDPAQIVGQLDGTGSTKVRRAPSRNGSARSERWALNEPAKGL